MNSAHWDQRYAGRELVWTSEPNRFLVQEVDGLTPGRALDDRGEAAAYLAGRGCELVVADDREHLLGVDGGDVRVTLLLVDDDVAREQDAELGLGLQRGVGERWVAGPEDEVGLAVRAECSPERRLDIDLA